MQTNPLVWGVLQGLSQLQVGRCEFNIGQGARSAPGWRPRGRRGYNECASASQLHAREQVGDPQVRAWRWQSFHHRALRLQWIVGAQVVDARVLDEGHRPVEMSKVLANLVRFWVVVKLFYSSYVSVNFSNSLVKSFSASGFMKMRFKYLSSKYSSFLYGKIYQTKNSMGNFFHYSLWYNNRPWRQQFLQCLPSTYL